jgi:uncharacterized protein (DUF2252 family)
VLSPFTFCRSSALALADDLAGTPSWDVRVQCGGDSDVVNVRSLATRERQVIFAINDLDETLPAPWGMGPQTSRGELRDRLAR